MNLWTFLLHIYCSILLDAYKYYFEILDLFDPPSDYFDKFRLLEKVTKVYPTLFYSF